LTGSPVPCVTCRTSFTLRQRGIAPEQPIDTSAISGKCFFDRGFRKIHFIAELTEKWAKVAKFSGAKPD
jgi:hypothetical protein